eukprot:Clim_evm22s143 gene=Clim_evmTU22s143
MSNQNEPYATQLQGLMQVLSEFYDPSSSPSRKRELEANLEAFRHVPDAWSQCLYFLQNTSNPNVLWYSASVLEYVAAQRWSALSTDNKTQIRSFLFPWLVNHGGTIPAFAQNKIMKALVSIAKNDWPWDYPDFYKNIMELMDDPRTVPLALQLIRMVSEEFTSSNQDVSAARNAELKKLLLKEMPQTLLQIQKILHSRYLPTVETNDNSPLKMKGSGQRPSGEFAGNVSHLSPNMLLVGGGDPSSYAGSQSSRGAMIHGQKGTDLDGVALSNGSPGGILQSQSPVSAGMLGRYLDSQVSGIVETTFNFTEEDLHKVQKLALECLIQIVSWIPPVEYIDASLLQTIFSYAQLHGENTASFGVLGLTCINEILSMNFIPPNFHEFLIEIFKQCYLLLKNLTSAENSLSSLDDTYLERCTDFLQLFVSKDLRRVEGNENFPTLELLELLFRYTLRQPNDDQYVRCLDIWCDFIDYIHARTAETGSDAIVQKYAPGLESLQIELLNNIMFTVSGPKNTDDEDEAGEDSDRSEGEVFQAMGNSDWKQYLRSSVEVIGRISELLPTTVARNLLPVYMRLTQTYVDIFQCQTNGNSPSKVEGVDNVEYLVRDTSTIMQLFTRLAGLYCNTQRIGVGRQIVGKALDVGYCTYLRTEMLQTFTIRKVHVQMSMLLQSYCEWLANYVALALAGDQSVLMFFAEAGGDPGQAAREDCHQLVEHILQMSLQMFSSGLDNATRQLLLAASQSLLSVTRLTRPPFLLGTSLLTSMMQQTYSLWTSSQDPRLTIEVRLLHFRATTSVFLLPWHGKSQNEQEWPKRSEQFSEFISPLKLQIIETVGDRAGHVQRKQLIVHKIELLKILCEAVNGEPKPAKDILMEHLIRPMMPHIYNLLKASALDLTVLPAIMDLLLHLFKVLSRQLGAEGTGPIIELFLEVLNSDTIAQLLKQPNQAQKIGLIMVDFLQLLRFIVQDKSAMFRPFTAKVVNLAIYDLGPLIAQMPHEVEECYFSLLKDIVTCNPKMIPRTPEEVEGRLGPNRQPQEGDGKLLAGIIEGLASKLKQQDIILFKQAIQHLEEIDERCQLFTCQFFRRNMTNELVQILLRSLLDGSHDLLSDEICSLLYRLASADWPSFFQLYLVEFLRATPNVDNSIKEGLLAKFKQDRDHPSFVANTMELMNDLKFVNAQNDVRF